MAASTLTIRLDSNLKDEASRVVEHRQHDTHCFLPTGLKAYACCACA